MYTSKRIRSYTAAIRKQSDKAHAGMTKNEFELKNTKRRKTVYIALSLFGIILLGVILNFSFYYGPSTDGWDSPYYAYFCTIILQKGFTALPFSFFSAKYIFLLGMSAFFKFFGIGRLSYAMYGTLALVLTTIIIYFIGKNAYDERVGITAAFIFNIIPITTILSSSGGDEIFVGMYTALTMLALVLAIKRKSKIWYLISGFIPFLGVLGSSEEMLFNYVVLVIILLFYLLKFKTKEQVLNLGFFALGIALAIVAIILLDILFQNQPAYYFAAQFSHARIAEDSSNSSPFINFVNELFNPNFNPGLDIYGPYNNSMSPIRYLINLILFNRNPSYFSYFGLFILFASAYLIYRKDKKAGIFIAYFYILFFYLSFGTISYFRYAFIYFTSRYALIFAPSAALIIGTFLVSVVDKVRKDRADSIKKRWKMRIYIILAALVILALIITLINSLYSIAYNKYITFIGSAMYVELSPYIQSIPKNATIYLTTGFTNNLTYSGYGNVGGLNILYMMPVSFFSGYKHTINTMSATMPNCKEVKPNTYFIIINTSSLRYGTNPIVFVSNCSKLELLFKSYCLETPFPAENKYLCPPDPQISLYKST